MSKQIRVSDTAHQWIVAEAQHNHRNIIGQVDAMVEHKPIAQRMAEMKPEDVPIAWRDNSVPVDPKYLGEAYKPGLRKQAEFGAKKPHPKGKSK